MNGLSHVHTAVSIAAIQDICKNKSSKNSNNELSAVFYLIVFTVEILTLSRFLIFMVVFLSMQIFWDAMLCHWTVVSGVWKEFSAFIFKGQFLGLLVP